MHDPPPTPRHVPAVNLPSEQPASARRRLMLFIGTLSIPLLCSLACLAVVRVSLAREFTPVTVIVGGEAYSIDTRAKTVAELLRELEIVLAEGDVLSPPADSAVTPGMVVEVNRARDVTLVVDGEARLLRTTAANPADILFDAGVMVSDSVVARPGRSATRHVARPGSR